MHRNPLVVCLAGLLASPATWAHSAEQTGHGLMFFHWHIADTGHVLGMSPAMLGVAAFALIGTGLIAGAV